MRGRTRVERTSARSRVPTTDRADVDADPHSRGRPSATSGCARSCATRCCGDVRGGGRGGAVDRAGQVRQREACGARAGGEDLGEHRDGGLPRGRRADVEADRGVQPGQLVVGDPALDQLRDAAVLRPSRPHRAHVPGAGPQRGEHQVGVEPVVVRHHADDVARAETLLREVPDGPVDDDLVGPRVAARGGEHRPGVAHRDAVAHRPRHDGQRRGELERAVDDHPGRGRRDLDEHLDAAVGTLDADDAGPVRDGHPVGQRTVERGHEHGLVAAGRRGEHGHVGRAELARVHAQDAAAGQADGERVLVGDAVLLHAGRRAVEHRGAQVVQGSLDAPAGDAAERGAGVVHGHRRADDGGRAAGHRHDRGDGDPVAGGQRGQQASGDLEHGGHLPGR